MSREVPVLRREAHAYVAADLADPDRLSVESHVCRPQAQMEALIEAGARALQREILLASVEIQRTHGRVAVLRFEQEGARGFPRGAERDRLSLIPCAEAFLDTGAVAHDDQVQRIAFDGSARIAGTSRLPLEPVLERGLVEFFRVAHRRGIFGGVWQRETWHFGH